MGFFDWLREGVRQAVVLGLADAVEDVGTRTRGEDLGPALAHSLRERLGEAKSAAVLETTSLAGAASMAGAKSGGRRRLGRSLDVAVDAVRKAA